MYNFKIYQINAAKMKTWHLKGPKNLSPENHLGFYLEHFIL